MIFQKKKMKFRKGGVLKVQVSKIFGKGVSMRYNGKFSEKLGTTVKNGLYLITPLFYKSILKSNMAGPHP